MQTVELDRLLCLRIVNQLEADRKFINAAILATPSGDERNKLTEINIGRMEVITILRRKLWRPGHPRDYFEEPKEPKDPKLDQLRTFIEEWDGHDYNCDYLDEGSPRTDCTCGYAYAREKVLKMQDINERSPNGADKAEH